MHECEVVTLEKATLRPRHGSTILHMYPLKNNPQDKIGILPSKERCDSEVLET